MKCNCLLILHNLYINLVLLTRISNLLYSHSVYNPLQRRTMKIKLSIALLLALPALNVSSAPICPMMEGTQIIIGASQEVFNAKTSGISKDELLKSLNSNPQAAQYEMLLTALVNEIYAFESLNPKVYAAYRTELCFAEQSYEKEVNQIDFAKAHPLLKSCENNDNPTVCAMKVVHQISDIPESL